MEIQGKQVKRGFKFIHSTFMDVNNQMLRCEVTKVTKAFIYWKRIGSLKADFYTKIENFSEDIKTVL